MAENLFIRLAETGSAEDPVIHLEWMLLDETSGIVRFKGEGGVDDFRELSADLRFTGSTCVMVPAEEVLLTEAVVPTKQPRQILQAVPFLVEENLASDVEDCHFAVGNRDEDGRVSVAVIDQMRMQYWSSIVKTLGITAQVMTTDALAVPQHGCSVLIEGERALLRFGPAQAVATSPELIAATVGMLSPEDKAAVHFLVAANDADAYDLQVNQLNAELEQPVQVEHLEYTPFESLCRAFDVKTINLLQGDFKVEEKKASSNGSWRSVAILAGCAFVLHLFLTLGEAVYLDLQAQALERDARTLYAEVHPNDRNVRDLRRRWQNHLRGGGAATGEFMSLFVETVKNIPGANLTLDNVNYNDSRGDLVMQMRANQSEQLISFAETLNRLGMDAEIGTINQVEGAVKGTVKVKSLGGV
jgi:general secretion pathway protein L